MSALYPSTVAPEYFQIGDSVRKFVTESTVTPYLGVISQICPSTYTVWVQWPMGNTQEHPETLVKVNPIFGLPTVKTDSGYSSYDKGLSDKLYGRLPKQPRPYAKMAIRVASKFADCVIGKLINDISNCQNEGLSDVQTYNRVFDKYANICSDYIIKSSIHTVYNPEK